MGISGLKRVFEMYSLLKWTKKYFAENPPDLQICCDSPAMNFHFAKLAHSFGIPVLYYIAPQLVGVAGKPDEKTTEVGRSHCLHFTVRRRIFSPTQS